MSNRLFQLLLLTTAIAATGITVATLSHGAVSIAYPIGNALSPVPAIHGAATLLPTVVVHPEARIPTLGLITVQPDPAERAPVAADRIDDFPLRAEARAVSVAAGTLSSAAFDMPYYSFGKTLHHVSKE